MLAQLLHVAHGCGSQHDKDLIEGHAELEFRDVALQRVTGVNDLALGVGADDDREKPVDGRQVDGQFVTHETLI